MGLAICAFNTRNLLCGKYPNAIEFNELQKDSNEDNADMMPKNTWLWLDRIEMKINASVLPMTLSSVFF